MKSEFFRSSVRKPSAAGAFYPDDPGELKQVLDELTPNSPGLNDRKIRALIVPHAGYVYSGVTAGMAFGEVNRDQFKRVVVLSPSHREAFRGVSVFPGKGYETPLGLVEIDRAFCSRLAENCEAAILSDSGHKAAGGAGMGEHALEVQLPFLQHVLDDFTLVPVVMGQQDLKTSASLGLALSGLCDDETLIVASSDLSHFHSYEEARTMDSRLVDTIARYDYFSMSILIECREVEACGAGPAMAAMIAAENCAACDSEIIDYRTSGDSSFGTRDQVVGYVSAALLEDTEGPEDVSELTVEEKDTLLDLAKASVESAVGKEPNVLLERTWPEKLQKNAAVFVTLTINDELRGCIGSIVPQDELYQAVASSAVNAALHDPRFKPVSSFELPLLSYEISVLSRFRITPEISDIEVGKHGLLIQSGHQQGLLLPQVATEYSWDRETFLEHTCRKASLPSTAWKDPSSLLFRFSAAVFNDR